eukprot:CAMPEP_0201988832 /NCGR_PEP_ID=MMETSP0904-20121228/92533_1 /ASSEMBLY_ACC=CAM_ASM_000553 /TAXON_ID=420261 /ORGANISM="Thalassiosira antarctica, Strain CCMP982" /LENGTH=477 /DNA_ID=CAMNT_0048543023 /DNA_START=61 /DNA_END=1492 /DNA_ORIENTATION=+
MYAGRTPTYYDDEAQSLAIATDYDILVDDETLNPSPLHVEDESAHAREVQEGCKRIRAECRRNMMAMMAMALAFLAMALFSIHTSLHRPYGIFFDSELAFLFWCMVLGASNLVAWVLCKQPNLHDSGDEDEAPSAARDRDASGLLAEAREGCNNLPAKYRRGTECVWPTYYDDEAQSLAIETDYDLLVDNTILNPSPLHVEDESAHARDAGLLTEVQEGYKQKRAKCRRTMMATMMAMALICVHISLCLYETDCLLIVLLWCMTIGASNLVLRFLCEQPNLHDSGDEEEALSAARRGLLAEDEKDIITYLQSTVVARSVYGRVWPLRFVREGYNNLPAKYRRGTECVWPPVALCWTIVWSFYKELPVYECLLLFLLWFIVMGSSILVAWVFNDKPDVYESDDDNVEETSNTPQEVPSARGEGGVSLLEEAQNNGSTKFPGRYRGGIAGVFLLALSVTLVSYDYFSKFKHLKFFPIAW